MTFRLRPFTAFDMVTTVTDKIDSSCPSGMLRLMDANTSSDMAETEAPESSNALNE